MKIGENKKGEKNLSCGERIMKMQLGGRVCHFEVTKKEPKRATHLQLGIKWDYLQICFINVRMTAGILEMRRCKNNATNLSCCQLLLMTPVEQQEKFISFHRFSLRLDCLLAATESETLSFCTLLCSLLEKLNPTMKLDI